MTSQLDQFPPDVLPDAPLKSGLKDFSLNPSAKTSKFDIETMSQSELLSLHAKIEGKLTGIRLSDVNLERETLIQLQHAKMLQETAKDAKDVPVNQLAQVQNSLASILTTLARMQVELHSSETIKRWKAAIIRVVKEQPKEFQTAFFELLEHEAEIVEQELLQ